MSHVVAYTNIVYPEAAVDNGTLAAALDELGMELIVGKKNFNWYGHWVKDYHQTDAAYKQGIDPSTYGQCEHVIRAKNAGSQDYEIGLVRNPNGAGYVPVLDFYGWGQKLRALVGDNGQHLGTAYNKAAIRQQAQRSGYALTEQKLESGKILMTAVKYGV